MNYEIDRDWTQQVDPLIYAQMQQMAQMLSSPQAQMMVQQQGETQANVVQDQTVANGGM